MKAAIMQPTFLPWLGWFDLADQVDAFVLLDDVAFSKQSWQQRNRIRSAHGLEYVSVPVRTSGRSGQLINRVEIADKRFCRKLKQTISMSYAKSKYFGEVFPGISDMLDALCQDTTLCKLNISLIEFIWNKLCISGRRMLASDFDVKGRRGEHVALLCEAAGGDEYLSPAGAENYLMQDRQAFNVRGIKIFIQEFIHPAYRQMFTPFIPYASTLDALFNLGPECTLATIRSGRRPSRELSGTVVGYE